MEIATETKTNFWKQWRLEYLLSLQQRFKWKKFSNNIKEEPVAIIKNEETQPTRWSLRRVVRVHPGNDVTLKTQNGLLKRTIHKLCPFDDYKFKTNKDETSKHYVPSTEVDHQEKDNLLWATTV